MPCCTELPSGDAGWARWFVAASKLAPPKLQTLRTSLRPRVWQRAKKRHKGRSSAPDRETIRMNPWGRQRGRISDSHCPPMGTLQLGPGCVSAGRFGLVTRREAIPPESGTVCALDLRVRRRVAAHSVARGEIPREIDNSRHARRPAGSGLWRHVSGCRHVPVGEGAAAPGQSVHVVSACALRFLC